MSGSRQVPGDRPDERTAQQRPSPDAAASRAQPPAPADHPDHQDHDGPSGVELAREALEQAKADARRRGQRPGGEGTGGTGRGGRPRRRRPAAAGGDPLPLRAAIDDFLSDRGWERQAAMGSVFGRWPEIVGTELAAHTRPEAFDDGVLTVVADSTAWATQVRLLAPNLIRRLCEELGAGSVRRVKVRGPTAPGWGTGPLRAPGSKGPRDTYG